MAAPFAAATLPYPWLLLSLVAGIPFVFHLARYGVHFPKVQRVPAIVWTVLLLGLFHLYGLWSGPTPFWTRVVVDMGIVALGVGVFLLGRAETDASGNEMLEGFFAALIPFVFVTAVVGLVKAALLERGILVGFVYALYPEQYPTGSSLRGDINLFGLSMLVAGLGLVANSFDRNGSPKRTVFRILALALIVSAGLLTESRRFLILSLLIPTLWLALTFMLVPRRRFVVKVLLPVAGLLCAIGALFWIIQSPAPFQKVTVMHFPGIPQDGAAGKMEAASAPPEENPARPGITVRQTDPATIYRLLGTMAANQAYGFESRAEKWRLGASLLEERAWLGGIGFAYHRTFSCRFAACGSLDYPHFPILSEWLVSGIAGAVAAVAIYVLLFRSIWRSGWDGWKSGSSALAVAVLPYSLLSGDTLFSIPQFIIICLLAQSQAVSGAPAIGHDRER
ncbi:MAG: hypothetical protein HPY67_10780 [Syntrophaceae bacterium]|nr:hypothetical protein [Syntrophaceae bacterium]